MPNERRAPDESPSSDPRSHAERHALARGRTEGTLATAAVILIIVIVKALFMNTSPETKAPAAQDPSRTAITAPTLAPGEQIYRIREGDTLSEIAAIQHVTVEAIEQRNRDVLDDWRGECLAKTTREPGACAKAIFAGRDLVMPAK